MTGIPHLTPAELAMVLIAVLMIWSVLRLKHR
jgi:hypothetical protein